jgi:hypothetical protein
MISQALTKLIALLGAVMPLPEQVGTFLLGFTVGAMGIRWVDNRKQRQQPPRTIRKK